jgi:hypothetical protein
LCSGAQALARAVLTLESATNGATTAIAIGVIKILETGVMTS